MLLTISKHEPRELCTLVRSDYDIANACGLSAYDLIFISRFLHDQKIRMPAFMRSCSYKPKLLHLLSHLLSIRTLIG